MTVSFPLLSIAVLCVDGDEDVGFKIAFGGGAGRASCEGSKLHFMLEKNRRVM